MREDRLDIPFEHRGTGNICGENPILSQLSAILEVRCALHGCDHIAHWSSWCSVAVHRVEGVIDFQVSGQGRVTPQHKS